MPRRGARNAVGLAGDLGLRWWSRERLYREAVRAAERLAAAGIGRGDRMVLWAPASPEWVAVFLGATLRGAVPAPLDPQTPAETVVEVVRREGARLVVAAGGLVPSGATGPGSAAAGSLEPAAAAGAPPSLPAGFDGAALASAPWCRLEELAGGEPAPPAPWPPAVLLPVTPEDPAVLLQSSGTAGAPRGVLLTHANLAAQLAPFLRWRRLLGAVPFRLLVLPPLGHVLGLVVGLLLPLALGVGAVFTHDQRPGRWAVLIRRHRIAALVAVPHALEGLAALLIGGGEAPAVGAEAASSARRRAGGWRVFWRRQQLFGRIPFRLILVGGATLPPALERFWRRAGILVAQGYGLTETAGFVTITPPWSRRAGAAGRPVGGQELRLAEDGEVLVRGANVAPGERAADGFLRTGDLGRLERGRLVVAGRKKELIVTGGGLNVVPDEVEVALRAVPGVREAAAVARPGAAGEEVHAVLVLASGTDPAAAVAEANRALPPHARVSGWTVWPGELPRGRLGKLRRGEIAAHVARSFAPLRSAQDDLGRFDLVSGVGGHPERSEGSGRGSMREAPLPNLEAVRSEPDRRRRLELLTRYLASARAPGESEELTLGDDLALGSLDVVELLGRLEGGGAATPAPAVGPASTIRELREALAAGGALRKSSLPVGPPWWWRGPHLRPWRAVARGAAIAWWGALGYEVAAEWRCDPERVPRPFLLAAAPHLAWLDAFIVYRALPPRLRRRFLVVTNRDLRPLFAPGPGTPRRERLYLAGAYYAVLPSLFPFTVLTPYGPTREALLATAGYLARGYGVLTFPKGLMADPAHHDRGPALLACETGAPLLPAVLLGNEGLSWRRARPPHRIHVRFGAPLWPGTAETPDALAARTEAALAALATEVRP